MTTKHMISPGIGFTPNSVRYIVVRGLEPLQLTDAKGRAEYLYYVDPRIYADYADERDYVAFRDNREYAKL